MKQSFAELSKPFHLKMSEFQKSLDIAAQSQDASTISEISKEFSMFRTFIVSTLQSMQQQLNVLSMQMDKTEMRSRRKMLLVHGVPENKDEDVSGTLLKLLTEHVSDAGVTKDSISKCHRMGRIKPNKSRAILLKFNETSVKDSIWYSKSNFKGTNITISEFLTKDRHDAFLLARRKFGITKCWTKEGDIVILGPDGSRHRAWCTKDVDAIPSATSPVTESTSDAGTSVPHRNNKDSSSQRPKRNPSKSKATKK